jgi:hypothetical protein
VRALHYIDWTNPNPSLPRTLTIDDLEPICNSGAIFCRKVHPERSAVLLDALDRLD